MIDEVHSDFFFKSKSKQYKTYTYQNGVYFSIDRPDVNFAPYHEIVMMQGQEKSVTKWTQNNISDFLSDIGGLFTSLLTGAKFLIAGFQSFIAQKSMLKHLYGEEDLGAT